VAGRLSSVPAGRLLAALGAAAVLPAPAAEAPLASLAWLAGCWAAENAEPGSGEQWMPLAGGSLLGMSRTVRGGRTAGWEFMRIAENADGVVTFFAQPAGKPPDSFPARTLTPTEVVFENLRHPFPQRVIYRFEVPDRLHARIEGLRDGTPRAIDYPLRRAACTPP
jgi:hypothetical protein